MSRHIPELLLVVREPRSKTTECVRGTNDDGVTNLLSGIQSLVHRIDGDGLCDRDVDLLEGLGEKISVLAKLQGADAGTQDPHAVLLQGTFFLELDTEVEGRLATKAEEDTIGALFLDDVFDVLVRNGLDIGE